MPARAIGSGTISFGLVSIPVKLYSAASPKGVSFHQLHKKCGSRIRMQLFCPVDEEVVERSDIVKGYEFAKNQFVQFTQDELKALEDEKTNAVDIVEFVPLETVDYIYIDKSYYLGPDKGGHKAYRLLSDAMQRSGKIAVGRFGTRGKQQLVLIRPYKDGLLLHQVFYADEVRSFEDIDTADDVKVKDGELGLAERLIEQLTTESFNPEQYRDDYRDRVLEAVEQKAAGQEITTSPERPKAQIIDLFEALKASLGSTPGNAQETSVGTRRAESAEPAGRTGSENSAKKAAATDTAKGPRKAVPRTASRTKKSSSA